MKEKNKTLKSVIYCATLLSLFSSVMVQEPNLVQATPVPLASSATEVGIDFIDGSLSLVCVPNFDFGSNKLDGKTRFVPLSSSSTNTVDSGAFKDQISASSDSRTLRDATKYRALIVSDSRLPINSAETYNGWTVSANMTVGSSSMLNGRNAHDLVGQDPNPDAGEDNNVRKQFPVAIEFGNYFGSSAPMVKSLTDGQSSNQTPISHPATYYNSDPDMKGKSFNSAGVLVNDSGTSNWVRVDSASGDVPPDNSGSGRLVGLFFPRVANSSKNVNDLTAVSESNNVTSNSSVTTIPMESNGNNYLWGYTDRQQNAAASSHPNSLSNGAWALDFHDAGSAILAMPKAVTLDRPGTYIYNIYWTLSAGFQHNP